MWPAGDIRGAFERAIAEAKIDAGPVLTTQSIVLAIVASARAPIRSQSAPETGTTIGARALATLGMAVLGIVTSAVR